MDASQHLEGTVAGGVQDAVAASMMQGMSFL